MHWIFGSQGYKLRRIKVNFAPQAWKSLCWEAWKSYITGIQKEGDKKVLIVEVTLKMSQYYQDIVADIRDALEKESITKAEAVSMRSELLLAYNSAL